MSLFLSNSVQFVRSNGVDKRKILALIEFYRIHVYLWDTKNTNYKDRDKRHYALMEIADFFGLDKQKTERKIKNL